MTNILEPEPQFGKLKTLEMSIDGLILVVLMKLFPVREEKKTGDDGVNRPAGTTGKLRTSG